MPTTFAKKETWPNYMFLLETVGSIKCQLQILKMEIVFHRIFVTILTNEYMRHKRDHYKLVLIFIELNPFQHSLPHRRVQSSGIMQVVVVVIGLTG